MSKYEEYGRLSHYHLDDLLAVPETYLLLAVQANQPRRFCPLKKKDNEPAWPSPWGEGRRVGILRFGDDQKTPGETIDIHGSGRDRFPASAKTKSPAGAQPANHSHTIDVMHLSMSTTKNEQVLRQFFHDSRYRSKV